MNRQFLHDLPHIREGLDYLITKDRLFKKHFISDDIAAMPYLKREADFTAFARTICGQQLSVKAAATIFGRVHALVQPFGPEGILAAEDTDLRGAGLSGRKVEYLKGFAQAVQDRRFDLTGLSAMNDDDVVRTIASLHGFGEWSGQMVLMFALARPDVFSPADLGLQEGLRILMKLDRRPTPRQAAELALRWKGRRTAASILLWQIKKPLTSTL